MRLCKKNEPSPALLSTPAFPVLFLAGLLLTLGLFAPDAEAQTPRSYRDGKEAAEAGQWAKAETAMRAAIEEDPEARRKAFSRYTPYYYLGAALAEQGDCRGALETWELTDRYGALRQGGDEQRDLKARRDRCTKLLGDVQKGVAEAEEAIENAESVSARLERLSRQAELASSWNQGESSLASRVAAGRATLDQARDKLRRGDAQLDLDLLAEAGYQASEALRAFEAVVGEAETRLSAINQAVSSAISQLDAAESRARSVLRSVRKLERPYPPQLGRRVSALRRVLGRIDNERDGAGADKLAEITADIERATDALRPLAAGPPETLREAAKAFLNNEFQAVADLAVYENAGSDRERYHAGLLEAAALHALWVTGGELDDVQMEQARLLIRELVSMDPALGRPGERFFSPRFRQLYEEVQREVEAEAGLEDSEAGSEDSESSDSNSSRAGD